MSSSVLLNGGSFAIGSADGRGQDRRYDDAWEPEDLVATVQFLATLDDRCYLPVSDSGIDFCHVHDQVRGHVGGGDPASGAVQLVESALVADEDVSQHSDSDTMREDASTAPADAASESSSAVQTPCSTEERSIIRASNKPAHLKRVSFGSTKGSMVETLIYEKPGADDEHPPSWRTRNRNFVRSIVSATTAADPLPEETTALLSSSEATRSASKVRVTYFESKRPLTLPSPEASDAEWDDTMAEPPPHSQPGYARQVSTESGQDNPFRPDGDLSREADELVELLKGGRPISEVLKSREPGQQQQHHDEQQQEQREREHEQQDVSERAEVGETTPLTSAGSRNPSAPSSPAKAGDSADPARANNGSVSETEKRAEAASSGVVEVQRAVAAAPAESQAEHVVIKKKSKCNCCVLQ